VSAAAAPPNHWKLGLFVLSGIVTGVLVLAWLGVTAGRKDTFEVVTYFDESVQGLEVGAPVKIRGARIGNVSRIGFAPDKQRIEVICEVDRDLIRRLNIAPPTGPFVNKRPDLRVQLSQVGIAGTLFVLADIVDPGKHPAPVLSFATPPNYVPAMPSLLKDLTEQLRDALGRFPELSARIEDLADRGRRAIDDADVAGVSSRAKAFLDAADAVVKPLESVAERAAKEGSIEESVKELPETIAAIRAMALTIKKTAADLDRLSESADTDLESLRETLKAMKDLADMLEHDPGILLRGRGEQQKGGAP
jgi:paraquat-inducible protein B